MLKKIFYLILIIFNVNLFGQNKLNIAVLDFDAKGISKAEASILSDELRYKLVNSEIYTIIERDKMVEILYEQGFQLSGCTSDECFVEAGKILNVKKVIAGSVGKIGSTYILNIRLIDIETSKIEKVVNKKHRGKIEGLLLLINGMSSELFRKTGSLSVITDPKGASLYLGNQTSETSPFKYKYLEAGQYKLSINLSYWQKEIIDVEVKDNKETKLFVPLKKFKSAILKARNIGRTYKNTIDYKYSQEYKKYNDWIRPAGSSLMGFSALGIGIGLFYIVNPSAFSKDFSQSRSIAPFFGSIITLVGSGTFYWGYNLFTGANQKIDKLKIATEKTNQKIKKYNQETSFLLEKERQKEIDEFNKSRKIKISYEDI